MPEGLRLADAVLIEPLSCAIHAYDVLSGQLGAHVLIYGSGTMGLITLELAKRVGVASVDIVDVNEAKLTIARPPVRGRRLRGAGHDLAVRDLQQGDHDHRVDGRAAQL